jgi:Bacterial-like globin
MVPSAGVPPSRPPSMAYTRDCSPIPSSADSSRPASGTSTGPTSSHCSALGGPNLAAAHRHLRISDAHFDRTAALLVATLDDLGVPRELTDQIVAMLASLRPAVVSA